MRRIVVFVAAVIVSAAPCAAGAIDLSSDNIYLRLDTGYSWSRNGDQDVGDNDVGDSLILGGGVGYRWTDHIRTDLTLSYRGWYQIKGDLNFDDLGTVGARANIQSLIGMINAYYDIDRFGPVVPYVGGGFGFSYNNTQTMTLNLFGVDFGTISPNSHTDFAWQFSVGAAIDVAPNTSIDVGYRYIDLGQVTTGNLLSGFFSAPTSKIRADLSAHEMQVGLRYSF